jgi:predicted nucleotidyltransferase
LLCALSFANSLSVIFQKKVDMKRFLTAASLGLFCMAAPFAFAQDKHAHAAHSHGVGSLELSVQAGKVSGSFEIPMESLLGHEHLPRTEAQKKAMANLQSGLASADYFMALPAAAQCKQISLKASSSMFEGKKSEHSDLDIDVAFECAQPAALTELRIALFAKHPRLKSLKVDMVGPKGQKSLSLSAKDPVLRF